MTGALGDENILSSAVLANANLNAHATELLRKEGDFQLKIEQNES